MNADREQLKNKFPTRKFSYCLRLTMAKLQQKCNDVRLSVMNYLGTTELPVVQHFRFEGGVHIGAKALLDINLIPTPYTVWLYRSPGILLIQRISTCLRYANERVGVRGGGQHSVRKADIERYFVPGDQRT
jgi:hypothetical protein